jgi:hypothetical protein
VSNFKFSPAATPQTAVEVSALTAHGRVVRDRSHVARTEVASDAERIADAKARTKALVKENNLPGAEYGFDYLPEYFKDCSGPETSTYDFEHVFFVLRFLEDSKFLHLSLNHRDGSYNSLTGVWTRGDLKMSIGELKNAVQNRIRELGISEVLLAEYLAVPHGIVEGRAFDNLSFEEKMNRFRAAA